MLSLTREERIVLIFLATCLTIGIGVKAFRHLGEGSVIQTSSEISGRSIADERTAAGIPRNPWAGPVNINTASLEELMSLNGIGRRLAERIVGYRESAGPFISKDELKKVKGIGEAIFKKIESGIVVE